MWWGERNWTVERAKRSGVRIVLLSYCHIVVPSSTKIQCSSFGFCKSTNKSVVSSIIKSAVFSNPLLDLIVALPKRVSREGFRRRMVLFWER